MPVPIAFAGRLHGTRSCQRRLTSSSLPNEPAVPSKPTDTVQPPPIARTALSNDIWVHIDSAGSCNRLTIQVAGIIIAAVFGAWAVKSYESANIANQLFEESLSQSNAANRLAQDALQQGLYANILAIINLCPTDQVTLNLFPRST